jgi:hypothetical protein
MAINIHPKTDYSVLFNSSAKTNNTSSTGNLSNMLGEYNTIKSGAYGKLMKAYFSEGGSERISKVADTTKNKTIIKNAASEEEKKFNKVSSTADSLQRSVGQIAKLGEDATEEEVYSAVSSYVKDYNNLLDASTNAESTSVDKRINTILNQSINNSKKLNEMGITVGKDGKLSLDKETLSKADKDSVVSAFADRGGYGYSVSVSAAMAASNANYEATRTSMYNGQGGYNTQTGSLLDSLM